MDDSSNGRAFALYPADPGSNPRKVSVWDHFVSANRIDGCIMSDKLWEEQYLDPTKNYILIQPTTEEKIFTQALAG